MKNKKSYQSFIFSIVSVEGDEVLVTLHKVENNLPRHLINMVVKFSSRATMVDDITFALRQHINRNFEGDIIITSLHPH